jgi:hypothetical protein
MPVFLAAILYYVSLSQFPVCAIFIIVEAK